MVSSVRYLDSIIYISYILEDRLQWILLPYASQKAAFSGAIHHGEKVSKLHGSLQEKYSHSIHYSAMAYCFSDSLWGLDIFITSGHRHTFKNGVYTSLYKTDILFVILQFIDTTFSQTKAR